MDRVLVALEVLGMLAFVGWCAWASTLDADTEADARNREGW